MDYTAALGNFGARHTIRWRNRDWPLAFITDRSRAAVEIKMKQGALAEARRLLQQGLSTELEYQEDRDRILSDSRAGQYQFGGPKCFRELARPDGTGVLILLLVLLQEVDPAVTEADVQQMLADEPDQVADVLALVRSESEVRIRELEKKTQDPN